MADGEGREATIHRSLISRLTTEYQGRPVAVSRAVNPDLKTVLSDLGTEVLALPISGGRTAWQAAAVGSVCVVDSPNHLGIVEPLPDEQPWIGVRRTTAIDADERFIDDLAEEHLIGSARRLRRRLTSIRGIRGYAAQVEAPWFAVLAADPIVLEREGSGIASILGALYPDLPGGVRIEVPGDASSEQIARYAAAVETAARSKDTSDK